MKNNYRNATYNAIGFIFPVVVALITTAYIVRKLTPEIYGIYVLAISLMGMMSFLDLGFGQGIVKFVSHYEATGDYEKINSILSASLGIFVAMGLLGFLVIFSLSGVVAQRVFHLSGERFALGSTALKVVAFGFFIRMVAAVFSNVPKAVQRYDISVKIQNAVSFCSTISTVGLLYFGKGLTAILVSQALFEMLSLIMYYRASQKVLPTLGIRIRFEKAVFREISGFSFYTALNGIMGNLVFRLDKMIIGAFLGMEAVTYYQVPFMIVQMANGFISSVTQSLFPAVSSIQALGDKERLRRLFLKSARYINAAALVTAVLLIMLGRTFLSLWMGNEFANKSAFIIPVLSVVLFINSISLTGYWFFNGMGKAKINFISALVGASCYLVAAMGLVPRFGLYGAAYAFAFVLVPFPVYFKILLKITGVRHGIFWRSLVKSAAVISLALSIKSIIKIPVDIKWFVLDALLAMTFSVLLSYLLRIIEIKDILELKDKLKLLGARA